MGTVERVVVCRIGGTTAVWQPGRLTGRSVAGSLTIRPWGAALAMVSPTRHCPGRSAPEIVRGAR